MVPLSPWAESEQVRHPVARQWMPLQARQAQAQLRSQEALLEVDVRRRQLEKLISELLAEVDSGEASIKARRDAVVGAYFSPADKRVRATIMQCNLSI